ncbi:sigma-70 family RNA polymerase sigma factor [Nocardia sp. PE-7]|uniref:RNA polymerase sigma factor n=1 Tax=Nocardia sp. PE-7 TaxID=3058426 RepID=UPI002659AF5E|nr:sigma-70 family RNA polymerase sigma factor [Nocardia sp. PE-7]WKG07441.1 sigma-70 family RNA polymerase sigma factor [Nocardia sp. PE-7]
MTTAAAAAVEQAHRREWAFVLAATVRSVRDFDLAEECVQDAYATALTAWASDGVPARPGAWLTTVARRRGLDLLRRESTFRRALPRLVVDESVDDTADLALADLDDPAIPDDRLRLISTCCHPALAPQAQVALTLRLVCGVTTAEVARAFLVSEATMAARITRAKKKIAVAAIPYRVPSVRELPQRLDSICAVIHLLFTTGHTAPAGEVLVRADLVDRSLQLARMMHTLVPDDPSVTGLLALILLTDARRAARVDDAGTLCTLEHQDRDRWDRAAIAEGVALVKHALPHTDRYTLQAAIAAVHDEAPTWADTDWREIIGLYRLLLRDAPSPVALLNHAIAVGLAGDPAQALALLRPLGAEPALATYGYLDAARAAFLTELGRTGEAIAAYESALLLTDNAVERAHLRGKLAALTR